MRKPELRQDAAAKEWVMRVVSHARRLSVFAVRTPTCPSRWILEVYHGSY
ncbi:MAG TPA: hypothetical protein VNM22_08245 [Candidatus Limnocylindrales bacterium]|nr:hypothetical protein [Candidatus Limnocylindrales bacterium]